NAAACAAVPTPEPIAFDARGEWFGTPSLVMSFLPGSPLWAPIDVAAWTTHLASTLAAIHDTALGSVPASMTRPAVWDRWKPTELSAAVREPVGHALRQ